MAATDVNTTGRGQLVVHMFSTLDGVVQSPGEPDEDLDGDFPHGGWQVPDLDADSGEVTSESPLPGDLQRRAARRV